MLNSYTSISNSQTMNMNINAVGGTIVKNYKDSFILRFHMKSEMAGLVLDQEPRLKRKDEHGYWEEEPVVVLQVMLCGDQEFLAEVMWKEDFDKMFESLVESEN